jgi:acetyl esterase/lipase
MSPWTDLTLSGGSIKQNAACDRLLPVSKIGTTRDAYLHGADPSNPAASPLFAAYPRCPPAFLQVAETEILRDDSLRMADVLRRAGADVELDLWGDLPHVWQIFQGWLPEADEALARIARFTTALFPEPSAGGN